MSCHLFFSEMPVHYRIELEFGNVDFWGKGKTGEPDGIKYSQSRVENQKQTQPTYNAGSGNRAQYTLVEGERSCTIPAHVSKMISAMAQRMSYFRSFWVNEPRDGIFSIVLSRTAHCSYAFTGGSSSVRRPRNSKDQEIRKLFRRN